MATMQIEYPMFKFAEVLAQQYGQNVTTAGQTCQQFYLRLFGDTNVVSNLCNDPSGTFNWPQWSTGKDP